MFCGNILSVCEHQYPSLLETRALLLRSTGLSVVSVDSASSAVFELGRAKFDLLVLCESVSSNNREKILRALAAGEGVQMKVLMLGRGMNADTGYRYDAIVDPLDPKHLIHELQRLCRKSATSAQARSEESLGVLRDCKLEFRRAPAGAK